VDWTARLWNVPAISDKDTAEDVLLLAELAEASGLLVQRSEQPELLHVLTSEEVREKRKKIAARFSGTAAGLTPLQRFLKWSVSEPRGRTISPFFEVTVGQWIKNRISEGVIDGLRVAIQVDPANARLAAHFGRRLATILSKKELIQPKPGGRGQKLIFKHAAHRSSLRKMRKLESFAPKSHNCCRTGQFPSRTWALKENFDRSPGYELSSRKFRQTGGRGSPGASAFRSHRLKRTRLSGF
jgi:hypothetical protein